jgi:hypothetical protein
MAGLVSLSAGNVRVVTYDWWSRFDRVTCRVGGHTWLDQGGEWLGQPETTTCIRCGTSNRVRLTGRHRIERV